MRQPAMETTMEKIARIYANKRDIVAVPGNAFATDGQKIYYVPMPDNTDPYILQKSKYGFLHEKDHCVFTDFTDLKAGKLKGSLHSIWNALEDTRIERLGAREWKGQVSLAKDALRDIVQKEINSRFIDPSVSIFKKVLDLLYLKVKEHELGDLGLIIPDKIQRLFDEKVGDQLPAIYQADTQEAIGKIAKTLHARMKDMNPPPPPQNQSGKGKPQKGQSQQQESDSDGQGQSEDNESEEKQSGKKKSKKKKEKDEDDQSQESSSGDKSENKETGEDEDDEDGSGSGSESDSSDNERGSEDGEEENSDPEDQDSGDSDDGGTDSESGDQSSSSDEDRDGEDSDGSGSVDSDDESDSGSGSDEDDGSDTGSSGGEGQEDDLKDERKDLAKQIKDNQEESSINDDIAKDVEEHADKQCIYRDANGLKENIKRYDGNDSTVRCYEEQGRKMLGGNTSKFKRLFISMRAPKMTRLQRSGRLDLGRVWNDDSDVIFQKCQPGILENSAVSMVIDNSASMRGQKSQIASALLSYMARELDRLRIPFECMGFTTCGDASLDYEGVRHGPILINLIKEFNEPYRKVRKHFQWPSGWPSGTVEFPCVRYAAQRLIHREETKKVLFILSDGESGCDYRMMEAMIDYIQRLIKAGIIVVGIGIQDGAIANYVPDTIVIQNLNRVAPEIFNKLTRILLKEGR